ncbi:MAG: tRNA (guanine-N1)-methyltransferase [Winogradskyella sp.]|uniref:tRNA (guanine-N1)-methyltransferase n=1 Tax=Winogradskyella sp. TaxID=1883156 RepID=UPI000F4149F8|nr:tRNA (guanine-N1)-methyltransferase [Winogradskyella sp.]RNC79784.1 MAG: tRNA (guanine-N1)-methyltransferase [Winogradskyella sp.]
MRNLNQVLFYLTLVISLSITAQNQQQPSENLSLDQGTIDSQFEYVFRKSGNFKGTNGQKYEAVKYLDLLKLKANTLDSLESTHTKLNETEKTVANQQEEIEKLKTNLASTQTQLNTTNAEKDNISLFGMQMSKTSYNLLLWSIIGGLLALTLLFIYRFNSSNSATKDAKRKLEEVEIEYEEHRRVALEREQKVRRQLQDEINKNKA